MKRIIAILLILILSFSIAACGTPKKEDTPSTTATSVPTTTTKATTTSYIQPTTQATTAEIQAPSEAQISPLLYKVTDDKNNTIWLFGSIHVGKDYFYPLPDYVTDAYNNSDALAVEMDIVSFADDFSAQANSFMKLIYTDGTKITDHISENSYERAVEILTDMGTYNSFLDYYKPFLWYSTIETEMAAQSGYDAELGIDMHFLNDAHENGKEIIEVESADFQYSMMGNFSDELQSLLLDEGIYMYDNPEIFAEDLKSLVSLWEGGDEKAISQYLYAEGSFETEEEAKLYEEYKTEMETKRNISMTDFAENALKSGEEVFICVGAAHVVGEKGMSGLLAERGYTVEIVK